MQPEEMLETCGPVEPERQPFWGYLDLAAFLGLMVFGIIGLLLALKGWVSFHPELRKDEMAMAMPLQFGLYMAIYLCFVAIFRLKYDRPVLRSLGWRKSNTRFWVAACGGVVMAFGLGLVAELLHTPKRDLPFDKLASTPFSMFLLALMAVVFAPLFEEMTFRGFLQPLLSRTFGVIAGVILTGVFFGALHSSEYQNQWQYVVAISLVGITLGTVRARTNSIIPGTIMHGFFNSVAIFALITQKYFIHK